MTELVELEIGQIGHIEKVPSIIVSREEFLEHVDAELESVGNPELTAAIRPVAETMPRFPMGTWINEHRGCGCIVGEYLIAKKQIDRAKFIEDLILNTPVMASEEGAIHETWPRINTMILDDPLGTELMAFGNDIDERLRHAYQDEVNGDFKNIEIQP